MSWAWSSLRRRSPPAAAWMSGSCRAPSGPHQQASPFFTEVHEELTRSWRSPYWARLGASSSSALTSAGATEEKVYGKLRPLNKSVASHLCPPTAISRTAKAAHSSKPCRTTSALVGCAYTSTGQATSALCI